MNEPIRVLQVVTKMERNGYESRIMDVYRNINRDKVQFDFYTHRKERGDFDDEIIKMGGRIFYNDAINPFRFLGYLQRLDNFFKKNHYDIVHAHLNTYCAWVLLAAKKNGVKVRIAHSRNSGIDPGWKTIFKRASKIIINIPPTHRFACSKKAGEWLFGKKFLEDKNSRVIPNAFDCDSFAYNSEIREEVRRELGIDKEFALVNVGRLSLQKNHKMIFSVFKLFKEKYKDARLYLFGDGELKDKIQAMSCKFGISDSVFFMGNRPDVYKYLNGMDVMLFPSIYEGFGTVAIEAQCNGLPVIASDVLPPETKLTNLIKYRSLKEPIEYWVEDLENSLMETNRINHSSEMKKFGYDMKNNAAKMQDFYIESVE